MVTVAIEVFKLLQTPPVVASVKVVVFPAHTDLVPPIAAGAEGAELVVIFTFPVIELEQVVVELVATTVYVPTTVFNPKLMEEPVPATTAPVFTLASNN